MGAGKIEYRNGKQRPELLSGETGSTRTGEAFLGSASNDERGGGGVMLKDIIVDELQSVREEMESKDIDDGALLDGWEKALLWVLHKIEVGYDDDVVEEVK